MTSVSRLSGIIGNLTTLAFVFVRELIVSSVAVARAALGREINSASAIIAVPVNLQSDMGVAMLANFITLTPGTTSLHVSEDRKTIYIHVLNAPAPDEVIADIKSTFERRLKEIEQ